MSVGRRRFRIIKEIAEGGFGKVYLAEQISSDGFSRIVAVKLLHAKWSSHDEVVMRTRDEARLLGLIRHQHIVKVEDLTSIDGKCAIVMEYLEGVDLKCMMTYLKDKGMVFPRAALFEMMLAVCSALDAAYNGRPLQGGDPLRVIHRDIKPSNIFAAITGSVKVLDFGTARANFAEREAKTQALAFGSQGYMAPERMLGDEDTPAADVFSLGVSLYELLSLESFGRIPPRPKKFNKKITELVASVPLEGPPAWCEQVRNTLRQMLSYSPDDRPSAAQLVEVMEQLSQDATDMGVRKFCRTVVGDAKAVLPELDTGDPLNGRVVDEDASSSFAALDNAAGLGKADGVTPLPTGMTAANDASSSQPSGSGGGGKMLLVGGVLVALLVALGIAVVGGGGLVAFLWSNSEVPVAEAPDVVPPSPKAEAPDGGRVVSPDRRSDAKVVPTTLNFGDSSGGRVTVSNQSGFKAEWDGKAAFQLDEMVEGRYSTVIVKGSGKKVRGKSFTVEPKQSCEFRFDVGQDSWVGGCK
jgi:serine/threonine protein kinase